MLLILYAKPDCHLCEGLQEKIEAIKGLQFELEVRDITSREDWFAAYQYEVPVLARDVGRGDAKEEPIPRPSPRASVRQVELLLAKYFPKKD